MFKGNGSIYYASTNSGVLDISKGVTLACVYSRVSSLGSGAIQLGTIGSKISVFLAYNSSGYPIFGYTPDGSQYTNNTFNNNTGSYILGVTDWANITLYAASQITGAVTSQVQTASTTPPVVTQALIGYIYSYTIGPAKLANSDYLAECAVWNAPLSSSEIQLFFSKVSPLNIRPSNLLGYWPLSTNARNYAAPTYFGSALANKSSAANVWTPNAYPQNQAYKRLMLPLGYAVSAVAHNQICNAISASSVSQKKAINHAISGMTAAEAVARIVRPGKIATLTAPEILSRLIRTNKTYSFSNPETANRVAAVGHIVGLASAESASRKVAVGKINTFTDPESVSKKEQVGKLLGFTDPESVSRLSPLGKLLGSVNAESFSKLATVGHITSLADPEIVAKLAAVGRALGTVNAESIADKEQVGKPTNITNAETVAQSSIKARGQTVSAAVANIAALIKQALKITSFTNAESASRIAASAKLFSVTNAESIVDKEQVGKLTSFTNAESVSRLSPLGKLLGFTDPESVSDKEQVGKITGFINAETVNKLAAITHAISYTLAQTINKLLTAVKLLSTTNAESVSQSGIKGKGYIVAATQANVASLIRQTTKLTAYINAEIVSRIARIARAISFTDPETVAIAKGQPVRQGATDPSSVSLVKQAAHILRYSNAESLSIARLISKLINAVSAEALSVVKLTAHTISYVTAQTLNRVVRVSHAISYATTELVSRLAAVARIIGLTDPESMSDKEQIGKIVNATNAEAITAIRQTAHLISFTMAQVLSYAKPIAHTASYATSELLAVARATARRIGLTDPETASVKRQTGRVYSLTNTNTAFQLYTVMIHAATSASEIIVVSFKPGLARLLGILTPETWNKRLTLTDVETFVNNEQVSKIARVSKAFSVSTSITASFAYVRARMVAILYTMAELLSTVPIVHTGKRFLQYTTPTTIKVKRALPGPRQHVTQAQVILAQRFRPIRAVLTLAQTINVVEQRARMLRWLAYSSVTTRKRVRKAFAITASESVSYIKRRVKAFAISTAQTVKTRSNMAFIAGIVSSWHVSITRALLARRISVQQVQAWYRQAQIFVSHGAAHSIVAGFARAPGLRHVARIAQAQAWAVGRGARRALALRQWGLVTVRRGVYSRYNWAVSQSVQAQARSYRHRATGALSPNVMATIRRLYLHRSVAYATALAASVSAHKAWSKLLRYTSSYALSMRRQSSKRLRVITASVYNRYFNKRADVATQMTMPSVWHHRVIVGIRRYVTTPTITNTAQGFINKVRALLSQAEVLHTRKLISISRNIGLHGRVAAVRRFWIYPHTVTTLTVSVSTHLIYTYHELIQLVTNAAYSVKAIRGRHDGAQQDETFSIARNLGAIRVVLTPQYYHVTKYISTAIGYVQSLWASLWARKIPNKLSAADFTVYAPMDQFHAYAPTDKHEVDAPTDQYVVYAPGEIH
jgi:hypothetical protein